MEEGQTPHRYSGGGRESLFVAVEEGRESRSITVNTAVECRGGWRTGKSPQRPQHLTLHTAVHMSHTTKEMMQSTDLLSIFAHITKEMMQPLSGLPT